VKSKKTSVPKGRRGPGKDAPARRRNSPARSRKRSRGHRVEHPAAVASIGEPVAAPPAAVDTSEEGTDIALSTPEPDFAGRALPPEPERPLPARRRAVFFDVENTSRPEHITRVIDHLAVDWTGWRTELIAVGNWKVIGRDTARLLARHGAHLVHSAPSVGVSDWSDLRIGVAAGVWLAGARPGDMVEIVTNDRAFDAVGDVAASLGISFRRISDHGLVSAAAGTPSPAPIRAAAPDSRPRRRGRGRRHRAWRDGAPAGGAAPARSPAPAPVLAEPPEAIAAPTPPEPHTAPHDEIIAVVHDLMQRLPARTVTLDTLANALKARGFSRTPGSPRLITRLRRIKEIDVSRSGVITLLGAGAATRPADEVVMEPAPVPPDDAEAPPAPPAGASRRRRSRRGRRRRPRSEPAPAV